MANDRPPEYPPHPSPPPEPPASNVTPAGAEVIAPPDETAAASRRTCTILGVIGGCGCLLLIAVFLLFFGGVRWFTSTLEEDGPVIIEGDETPGIQDQGLPDVEGIVPEATPPDSVDQPTGDGEAPTAAAPGEEAAKAAALAAINEPEWVTRVDDHSADWRTAVISAGPPNSEWVYVVTLQWDESLQGYALESVDDVDYPGFD